MFTFPFLIVHPTYLQTDMQNMRKQARCSCVASKCVQSESKNRQPCPHCGHHLCFVLLLCVHLMHLPFFFNTCKLSFPFFAFLCAKPLLLDWQLNSTSFYPCLFLLAFFFFFLSFFLFFRSLSFIQLIPFHLIPFDISLLCQKARTLFSHSLHTSAESPSASPSKPR
jgi:hypothetical protein